MAAEAASFKMEMFLMSCGSILSILLIWTPSSKIKGLLLPNVPIPLIRIVAPSLPGAPPRLLMVVPGHSPMCRCSKDVAEGHYTGVEPLYCGLGLVQPFGGSSQPTGAEKSQGCAWLSRNRQQRPGQPVYRQAVCRNTKKVV
jgi:hypothetical protein